MDETEVDVIVQVDGDGRRMGDRIALRQLTPRVYTNWFRGLEKPESIVSVNLDSSRANRHEPQLAGRATAT